MQTTKNNETIAKLGFSHLETAEIVVKLNLLLANYQIHFHRMQNFYWNVKGRDFFELHDKFGTMYEQSFDNINGIAERIRVFNQVPVGQLKEAIELSELEVNTSTMTGEQMVHKIIDDLGVLLSFLIEASEIAAKNGDVGTVDLVNGLIKQLEKDHWMLTAWLQTYEVAPIPQNQ